jgi:hypothetical protein
VLAIDGLGSKSEVEVMRKIVTLSALAATIAALVWRLSYSGVTAPTQSTDCGVLVAGAAVFTLAIAVLIRD